MIALYLTNDLFFSSPISSLAGQAGVDLRVVGSRAKLAEQLATFTEPATVLVDLEHRDATAAEMAAVFAGCPNRPRVIAYAPHVKEDLLAAGEQMGCERVVTRGQFHQQVSQWLLPSTNV